MVNLPGCLWKRSHSHCYQRKGSTERLVSQKNLSLLERNLPCLSSQAPLAWACVPVPCFGCIFLVHFSWVFTTQRHFFKSIRRTYLFQYLFLIIHFLISIKSVQSLCWGRTCRYLFPFLLLPSHWALGHLFQCFGCYIPLLNVFPQ